MNCPNCLSNTLVLIIQGNEFDLFKCLNCDYKGAYRYIEENK